MEFVKMGLEEIFSYKTLILKGQCHKILPTPSPHPTQNLPPPKPGNGGEHRFTAALYQLVCTFSGTWLADNFSYFR